MSFVDEYTNFIFLEDQLEPADIIFIPGSDERALALKAAGLWKEGYAPVLLPSGKYGKLTGHFTGEPGFKTEWEYFRHILITEGVPKEAVWKEDQATFPETELLVCPVATKGVSRDNWFLEEESIRLVLNEMKHCGTQFHEIFLEHRKELRKLSGVR